MPKVSVIVPVYNVESYIERCVRSLFSQTICSVEYIFVDDCGSDDSVAVLRRVISECYDNLSRSDKSVKIISNENNSGLASTRKHGIQYATGDYIIHCDSDDWVDPDLYERMYEEAVRCDADIVVCGSVHEYDGRSEVHPVGELPENCKEVMRNWYKDTLGMHCWNKMVRRSLYTDNGVCPWEGLNMWEDNGLMARLFYYGGRLSSVDDVYYHYNRANTGAMTSGYGQKQVRQMIGIAKNLTDFFESKQDAADFKNTVSAFQFLAKINLITDSFSGLKEYHSIFPESESIVGELDRNAFSSKGRFRFYMVRYNLAWLFILMFKVRNMVLKILHGWR